MKSDVKIYSKNISVFFMRDPCDFSFYEFTILREKNNQHGNFVIDTAVSLVLPAYVIYG